MKLIRDYYTAKLRKAYAAQDNEAVVALVPDILEILQNRVPRYKHQSKSWSAAQASKTEAFWKSVGCCVRSAQALTSAQIESLEELSRIPLPYLMRYRNFGKKALAELADLLERSS